MLNIVVISVLVVYFVLLLSVSHILQRGKRDSNAIFFTAGGNASWWVVSIGMIGASVSGVSFLSVPGMVKGIGFQYMQTVLGFVLGYVLIAKVLLPVYYKLKSPSIYEFLLNRFGRNAYKTGSWFFLISKLCSTAAKVYVIALVLHSLAFVSLGVPFVITSAIIVFMIWFYTRRGGLSTIVWTDALQTVFMVLALVMIIAWFVSEMQLDVNGLVSLITDSQWSQWVELDDWASRQHFVKQFLSGAFIAVVMTGLDQDMIQKNRAIRTLKQSQRNMYWYGSAFVPLNFLFLLLGVLMLQYSAITGIMLPVNPDESLPFFVSEGYFGVVVSVFFVVGVVAATFSSADSSLTSLTTSFCVDIAERHNDVAYRKKVHIVFSVLLLGLIFLINQVSGRSLIDLIYVMVSYTYGPLLGLFAFGLFTRRTVCDKAIPYIAILSPVACCSIDVMCRMVFDYSFGYELLMLNGAITFAGLWLSGIRKNVTYV